MVARAFALTLVLLVALPAVAHAKVSVFDRDGRAFEPPPSASSDDWYRITTTAKATAFCGRNATLIGTGWGGAGGFVGGARMVFNSVQDFVSLDVRQSMITGKMRAVALCARGAVRATVKSSKSGTVRCGRGRITLGVPAPPGSPFQDAAAVARPSGATSFTSNLGDDSKTATAVCVNSSAFRSVKVVKKTGAFKVGSQTATVTARCTGGRRAIGWGYEAAVTEQNVYRKSGITNTRTTSFPSTSAPRGAREWRVKFQTPDGQPAKTPAAVTAYATCAIPR